MTAEEAIATLAAALSVIERNVLGLVHRGRARYLDTFPADVAALHRLTTLGLITGRPPELTPAGRAVLASRARNAA